MKVSESIIDGYWFEFWNQHYPKLQGTKSPRNYQFKYKLFPYYGTNYTGESELMEKIKTDEVMDGNSIFCKLLNANEALALSERFSILKRNAVEVDDYIEDKSLQQNDLFFFVAYVFTKNQEFDWGKYYTYNYNKIIS